MRDILRSAGINLVLIVFSVFCASTLHAKSLPDIRALFSAESFEIGSEIAENGVMTYGNVSIFFEWGKISIDDLKLETKDDDSFTISLNAATIDILARFPVKISIRGFMADVENASLPIDLASCTWPGRIGRMSISSLNLTHEAPLSLIERLFIFDFSMNGAGEARACRFSGEATARQSDLLLRDGERIVLSDIQASAVLPLGSLEAASSPSDASLTASVRSAEYVRPGEAPAFSLSGVDVSLSVSERSLAVLLRYLETLSKREGPQPSVLKRLEWWNVLTSLDARVTTTSQGVRIHAPGVVPKEWVANFRQAGISTMTGSMSANMRLENRSLAVDTHLAFTGIAELSAQISGLTLPYSREKLSAASRGANLGYHAVPDFRIQNFEASYHETGIEAAVMKMTGASISSLISQGSGLSLSPFQGGFLDAALPEIARFFGRSRGNRLTLKAQPSSAVSILEALTSLAIDPFKFADRVNLTY